MANLDRTPRVGRSQGAVIFWGLVSVFFAAAFCYYYWKNLENEESARQLRDEVLTLQQQREDMTSEKDKQQASLAETKKQLDARDEFLQEKETKLAAEESQIESPGQPSSDPSQQKQPQASAVKKFDDAVRKLSKGNDDFDVVQRGGRPVLRVPNATFFALGDATLKPDGKELLTQIAQALDGELDNFELRVESYTDSDAEIQSPDAAAPPKTDANGKSGQKPAKPAPPPEPAAKPRYGNSWDLTSARATAISRFLCDQTSLPFQNVIVVARADFKPVVAATKEGHARSRRIEITITPVPAPYHAGDLAHGAAAAGKGADAPVDPLAPPPDSPASAKGN